MKSLRIYLPQPRAIIWFIAFTLATLPGWAQVRDKQMTVQEDDGGAALSPGELDDFRKEVNKKMKELQSYISIIGDKSKPDDFRNLTIKLALKLFTPDSKMQVTSLSTGKTNTYSMLDYFNQLHDLAGYTQVKITFYDVVKIDEWKSEAPGKYSSSATYFQQFQGIRNGKMVYTDRTQKKVGVSLSQYDDAFYQKKGWAVILGNVTAEDTYAPPKQ